MTDNEKPFVCNEQGCGMRFTNEDHLTVHKKKHDISLSLTGKSAFIADQTPTPTRFFRYGEEVGLFQDLQNVNPFEEQFKKAAHAVKMGETPAQPEPLSGPVDDALHTPQVFHIRPQTPPIAQNRPEEDHPDIEMEVILPGNLAAAEHNSPKPKDHIMTQCQPIQVQNADSKKFMPIIRLPDGQYVTLMGDPVQPTTVPTVVIPSSYVNSSVHVEELSVSHQVQHTQPLEPVAGPSKCLILPKPVPAPLPRKLSLAKERLKEKVIKNKVTKKVVSSHSASTVQPPKPSQESKSPISENDKTVKKLERNRAAAARFRKKKKQMESVLLTRVNELEERVRELQNENKRITSQMIFYRTESANAKDLLLAHRNCSVSKQMSHSELVAVVDSSTQLKEVVRVDSTAEVVEVHARETAPPATQVPITVRRASAGKAASLTPLVIVRQNNGDGNGVLRYGSSETVIVENMQRSSSS